MSVRKAAVAGQFYPASANEIIRMIERFDDALDKHIDPAKLTQWRTRAVIVPHAGYIYSGFTANAVLRILASQKPERIVVIGPSHRVYFKGFSVSMYDRFETPLGDLTIDTQLARDIAQRFGGGFAEAAHHEHSTEVQMPLIKYRLPDVKVVEVVYGEADAKTLADMIAWLLEDPKTAVVISTDLSHYYDIKKAQQLDNICLKAVDTLDTALLHRGCEACGKLGVEAMLIAAKRLGLRSHIVDYRTSADASGDTSQVVGYMGAVFSEN
jgi:AmmeMemoRadiSam system protein B